MVIIIITRTAIVGKLPWESYWNNQRETIAYNIIINYIKILLVLNILTSLPSGRFSRDALLYIILLLINNSKIIRIELTS